MGKLSTLADLSVSSRQAPNAVIQGQSIPSDYSLKAPIDLSPNVGAEPSPKGAEPKIIHGPSVQELLDTTKPEIEAAMDADLFEPNVPIARGTMGYLGVKTGRLSTNPTGQTPYFVRMPDGTTLWISGRIEIATYHEVNSPVGQTLMAEAGISKALQLCLKETSAHGQHAMIARDANPKNFFLYLAGGSLATADIRNYYTTEDESKLGKNLHSATLALSKTTPEAETHPAFSPKPFQVIRDYLATCRFYRYFGRDQIDTAHHLLRYQLGQTLSQEKDVGPHKALAHLIREINDFGKNPSNEAHGLRACLAKNLFGQDLLSITIQSEFGTITIPYEPELTPLEWETRFKELKRETRL